MLQAVSNIAPRGVYVCGNATSTSGLTVLVYADSGNFICVFECTIVNLATYRQFTNAA